MEQEINIKQQLAVLLADPEKVRAEDRPMLKDLASLYPYFQPLHLLLAKAELQDGGNNPELATAALYTNGQLLHNFLHEPEYLVNTEFKVVLSPEFDALSNEPEALDEAVLKEVPSESEEQAELEALAEAEEQPESESEEQPELEAEPEQEAVFVADEQEVFDEIAELDVNAYPQTEISEQTEVSEPAEINEVAPEEAQSIEEEANQGEESPAAEQEEAPVEQEQLNDDFVLENIVSTDFFAFQDNFSVETVPEELVVPTPVIEEYQESEEPKEDPVVISKYDDDQLPYTFLWWLHKTRKEYQQIFQPYAAPKADVPAVPGKPNELQQQYVEHIFHLQSPFSADADENYTPANLRQQQKGTDIIDSFLKNDPQISPPNAEQINTENKAKKSAEDHNDLVSETLAKIYIEQMLYDKAIETYEKLSLKFPEKSRYFADLIQSIEKKI